jgi:hypothetical protein
MLYLLALLHQPLFDLAMSSWWWNHHQNQPKLYMTFQITLGRWMFTQELLPALLRYPPHVPSVHHTWSVHVVVCQPKWTVIIVIKKKYDCIPISTVWQYLLGALPIQDG